MLLAIEHEINDEAIMLPDGSRPSAAKHSPSSESENRSALDGASVEALVGRTVADVERELIIDTLKHCLGNRTHAATILGISIRTLRNKLKQYTEDGLPVPTPGEQNHHAVSL